MCHIALGHQLGCALGEFEVQRRAGLDKQVCYLEIY